MRTLLESLGIVESDRNRREPVALPAWFRWMAALLVLGLALLSLGALALIRALFA